MAPIDSDEKDAAAPGDTAEEAAKTDPSAEKDTAEDESSKAVEAEAGDDRDDTATDDEAGTRAEDETDAADEADEAEEEEDEEDEEDLEPPSIYAVRKAEGLVESVPTVRTRGIPSAVAAMVGGALGFASISGTWIGSLMEDRSKLVGQAGLGSSSSTSAQVEAIYGHPWHIMAMWNGITAAVAVVITAVVLLKSGLGGGYFRPAPWVRALAWAGLILGLIGLLASGLLYFDVFTHLPKIKSSSTG
ncbi:hypothetical protein BIV57_19855 [Mangrovactinospora gilvigrisea]|uniref:Uncharacterized protein n=1 Tax=Mangrovactinospora gilvigrisea TaxID=1428644 RepID=A0A1J7BAU2_9ACTN|nr:hypothetical protein [Mangrovactinospora gilvigrisea]OIV35734.1 hypothetical protein BIV57_19855 [Mangrovactinospora gilvigrisea]